MGKVFRYIAFVFIVFWTVGSSHAAEELKIKPTGGIYVDGVGKGMVLPEGVSCDDSSHLVIADTGNGRLLTYAVKEGVVNPGTVITLAQLPYPIRVQTNSKGELFSLDGRFHKIARLTSAGEFIGYVETSGLPSQGSVVSKSFTIDSKDNIYILDIFSRNVIVLNPAGQFQRKIPFPDRIGFFSDLVVDTKGNVFVIDSVDKRVYSAPINALIMSPATKSLKEYLKFPVSISLDSNGRIFIVDQNDGGIVILGQDGSYKGRQLGMGWNEGFLRYPSQICITKAGSLFVADRGNNRVQIFSIQEK